MKWSEEYYKWHEISIEQSTQYLKVTFGQADYNTKIAEVAVINQADQLIPIQSITNRGTENKNLKNLIDEQDIIQYPSDYRSNTYFDEIYFVRTAEQYLHLEMPYEWTHPPLGKLIQAAGIAIFGFNPFGWRIIGVIFATLMIALIYLLGKTLFDSWIGGFAAAFLLTFDFMHFTMARMGTVDTYVVFFSLASQLFFLIYLKNVLKDGWKTSLLPLFFAIIFFALGFSTKWLVLYGFLGQLSILVALRLTDVRHVKDELYAKIYAFLDRPYAALIGFLLVAILIYFSTFIPDMLAGRSFIDVLGLQGGMYYYHSTLTATHSFSSQWYTWPLMFHPLNNSVYVPVWLQVTYLPDGLKSTITLMGNPALWWGGFAALIAIPITYVFNNKHDSIKQLSLKKYLPEIFILTFFFFQWFPYVFISRVVFIYHFYANVPFLCLAIAYFVNKYWSYKLGKILTITLFTVIIIFFVIFYPIISGIPTSTSIIDGLKWFGGWVF
jgi:dolichyl-phosphate-mannose--protein O-mannosyl transferase